MKAFALKFVRYDRIEQHLQLGWMVMIPKAACHHQIYGIEMKWICSCKVPGGFKAPVEPINRVPEASQVTQAG